MNPHAEHVGREGYRQVVLKHRVEAGCLLGLVVRINRRFLDERVEFGGKVLFRSLALLPAAGFVVGVITRAFRAAHATGAD